jgi:hypothetical protein
VTARLRLASDYLTDERIAFDRYQCALEHDPAEVPDARRAIKMLDERRKRFPVALSWNETRAAWDRYACAALQDGAGVTMAAKRADLLLKLRIETFGRVE